MIKLFTGDDRVRATAAIDEYLGPDHETIDCATLTPEDLPSIFHGTTLFATHRRILLRDFTQNPALASSLEKYLDTPHDIALLETKLDKRSSAYKAIKAAKLPVLEFTVADPRQNLNQKFDLYRTAKRDGRAAVQKLQALKSDPAENPIMLTGLIISQAMKDFAAHPQGIKERKTIKALAETDLQMKTTSIDGWLLLESFLLRLSTL